MAKTTGRTSKAGRTGESSKSSKAGEPTRTSESATETPIDPDTLPGTLQRSDERAQRTYAKTLESAEETYDSEEAAHRVAFAALKHTHEKVGDHWEPKEHAGPSDAQAEGNRDTDRPTAGGVDANAPKKHLYELATRLEIRGRSQMTKPELVEALQKANNRISARARR